MIVKVKTKQVQDSISTWNNSDILEYTNELSLKAYEQNKKALTSNLRVELEKAFGKCNRALRLEYYTRVWVLEFRGLVFNVFTAKDKGTSIEVVNKTFEEVRASGTTLEKNIKDFMDQLFYTVL